MSGVIRTLPATRWHLPPLTATRAVNVVALVLIAGFWLIAQNVPGGGDAHGYWYSMQPGVELYGRQWNIEPDGYVYSPVAAMAFHVITWLPYPLFYALWTAFLLGVLVWLIGPGWAALALMVPNFASFEVQAGNINLLLAASVVLGLSGRGAAWTLPLLTKVTPGVGMLWHLARREWRQLTWAAGATLALIAVSLVLMADQWPEWFRVLRTQGPPLHDALLVVPIALRLPVAAGLVLLAARMDWRWLVAVAVWLALPNWSLLPSLTVLLAIPRLSADRVRPNRVVQR